MSDAQRSWWLDADRTWRHGAPPDGWQQGSDGRWHAPYQGPEQTTEELAVVAAPWSDPPPLPTELMTDGPARHLTRNADDTEARRGRARPARPVPELPSWLTVAVPALVAVVLLSAAGVLVAASKGTDGGAAPSSDEVGAPADGPAADRPTSTTTPTTQAPGAASSASASASASGSDPGDEPDPPVGTTAPATTTTTASSPPEAGDPLAACSTGQRNVIERGNHPWAWYLARFDGNGDGVLCN